ncbi:hypothetical protein WDV13_00860 [Weissella cibaria]
MAKINNEVSGNRNIVVNGDKNTVIGFGGEMPTPTEIYRLLDAFVRLDISTDEEYELKSPAELNEKLIFNRAVKHISLFEDYADVYTSIDKVLSSEFQESEDVDLKLKRLYLQNDKVSVSVDGNIVVENGDLVLADLNDSLISSIKGDPNLNTGTFEISQEKIEVFVIGLLMRGISMCKVLQTPDGEEVQL